MAQYHDSPFQDCPVFSAYHTSFVLFCFFAIDIVLVFEMFVLLLKHIMHVYMALGKK